MSTSTIPWDAIVVGAGVNGLVCAAYLAKAGRRTLVLEARPAVGGGAADGEIAPGFRVPALAHRTGPLRRDVVNDLLAPGLRAPGRGGHALTFLSGPIDVAALDPDGGALVLTGDPAHTANLLRRRSPHDAEAWPRFVASRDAIGRVIASLFAQTPPDVDAPSARDLWQLLRTLREFRALPREDAFRLLRWAPMPVADLVSECFESELLRAAVAADGIFGTMLGPWSAGSGMRLMLQAADDAAAYAGSRFVQGGPGRLAEALAGVVREAGGEIRTNARVARIVVRDERAAGVALASGDEIAARCIVSGLDPRRTFLDLCDPLDLTPELLWRMRHYRSHGTVAKVNFALSALPTFTGVGPESLTGLVRIGPTLDYLERAFDHAKYGRFSPEPWIELAIPSLMDPSLAPTGAHVMSAYAQFAPRDLRGPLGWDSERNALGDVVASCIERCAPGFRGLIVAREVITPLDLDREWGMTGGHIFHGELALDQLFTMRPLLGWGRYRTPIEGLYMCGSGTHPGTGLTGGSGANAAREVLRS